ncbi:MAG: copper homeostasis protein CutC [Flavisolibacter sp.]
MKYIIEVATNDFISTRSAVEGGADRIELCAGLSEGGLTPSFGTIRHCREAFNISLFPIIRNRGGDFLYKDDEFQIMMQDIRFCRETGCDGVVFGLLRADGEIDMVRTARLIELAYPMEVTFHRAFDRCRDPFKAMEELIQLGCQRILTSGQQPGAPQGVDVIAALVKAASDRIIVMPGSGVRKENIKELKEKTGAVEFHSSLRGKTPSEMKFFHPAFGSGDAENPSIDPAEVKALRKALTA